jgi:hypothetical protein
MVAFEAFFRDLDAAWGRRPLKMQIIGSAALMLQTDYRRGTKDSDVLETSSLELADKQRLLELGGLDSPIFHRHRLYVDVVANGIPLLPHGPRFVPCEPLSSSLHALSITALDVVDVVVSKFKRFSANDQNDIQAMVERDLVPHDRLIARFKSAVELFSMDARAEDLPKFVRRLHRVERDLFNVSPTEIELPDWL